MATISDRADIDTLIANNGLYPGDEQSPIGPVVKIVEYQTVEGATVWGVVYLAEVPMGLLDRYDRESGYVRNPKVIWTHPEGPGGQQEEGSRA
jgi:hypothetical protein